MSPRSAKSALLAVVLASCAGLAIADELPAVFVNTQSGTIDCEGRDVNLTASNAVLTLTGNCKGVYFVGSATKASIESTGLVQISVNDVHVTVRRPVDEVSIIGSHAEATFDKVGRLQLTGSDSRVQAGEIATLNVIGSGNTVRWTSGSPRISDVGSDNSLQPSH